MTKRAGIYIRVSSESQAEKVSPQAQEQDCISYCENHDYQMVEAYRDIEKYRVGKKLVEPAGTRADRPQYKRMISDAYSGNLDVIIAWREDRLYRGFRPMLDLSDCLDKTDIDVELVKETFDKKMMGIKASVAKMELDAKHDRIMMGVAGRLSRGRGWNGQAPYGYKKDGDGHYLINEDEAVWVRLLFQYYSGGASLRKIRLDFVTQNAPQRKNDNKWSWSINLLRTFLRSEYYWTGKQRIRWDGKIYEIDIPVLIEVEIAKRVKDRRSTYKHYPAGHISSDFLVAGLIYCPGCGIRMRCSTRTNQYVRKDGTVKKYLYYTCPSINDQMPGQQCQPETNAPKIDNEVWERVWAVLSSPESLMTLVYDKYSDLQEEEDDAQTRYDELINKLEELNFQEQRVLTPYRKNQITQQALDIQLEIINSERTEIKRELEEKKLLLGNNADKLFTLVQDYRDKLLGIVTRMNSGTATAWEKKVTEEYRSGLIKTIVTKVIAYKDRPLEIHTAFDFENVHNINFEDVNNEELPVTFQTE